MKSAEEIDNEIRKLVRPERISELKRLLSEAFYEGWKCGFAANRRSNWAQDPCKELRKYPDQTRFWLRLKDGRTWECELFGNLPKDEHWKFVRVRTHKISYLERYKNAEFLVM